MGKTYHSQEKVGFDLSLDLGKGHGMFGDASYITGTECMKNRQTNILLCIYIDHRRCLVQLFFNVLLSPVARLEDHERPIFITNL